MESVQLLLVVSIVVLFYQCLVAGVTSLAEEGYQELQSPFPDIYTYICGNSSMCGNKTFGGLVTCNCDMKSLDISSEACMTYDWNKKGNVSQLVAGYCPFTIMPNNSLVHYGTYTIPGKNVADPAALNKYVCDPFKRNGTICGKCNLDFSLVLTSYTFQCVNTTDNHCHAYKIVYLMLADLIPLTAFFSLIVIFHINITSGYANAYILFANMISLQVNILSVERGWNAVLPKKSFVSLRLSEFLAFCYSFWSLDIGRPMVPLVCLGHEYGGLFFIAAQYVPAFYCLFLVVLTYALIELHQRNCRPVVCLWMPFRKCLARCRRKVNPRASVVGAFATFILLSYSKFIQVSLSLLLPSRLYDRHGEIIQHVLMYNAAVRYLGREHMPYFILSVMVVIVFVIVPPVILFVYPFKRFQHFLHRFHLRHFLLTALMDAFQGCYRTREEGKLDCRPFSAVYFVLRIILFVPYVTLSLSSNYFLLQLLINTIDAVTILMLVLLHPYRRSFYNKLDIIVLLYCSLVTSFCSYNWYQDINDPSIWVESIFYVYLLIPFVAASIYFIYLMIASWLSHRKTTSMEDEEDAIRAPLLTNMETCSSTFRGSVTSVNSTFPDRLVRPGKYDYA